MTHTLPQGHTSSSFLNRSTDLDPSIQTYESLDSFLFKLPQEGNFDIITIEQSGNKRFQSIAYDLLNPGLLTSTTIPSMKISPVKQASNPV